MKIPFNHTVKSVPNLSDGIDLNKFNLSDIFMHIHWESQRNSPCIFCWSISRSVITVLGPITIACTQFFTVNVVPLVVEFIRCWLLKLYIRIRAIAQSTFNTLHLVTVFKKAEQLISFIIYARLLNCKYWTCSKHIHRGFLKGDFTILHKYLKQFGFV